MNQYENIFGIFLHEKCHIGKLPYTVYIIHSLDIVIFPCGNLPNHHLLHIKHNQMNLAKGDSRKELEVAICLIATSSVFLCLIEFIQ